MRVAETGQVIFLGPGEADEAHRNYTEVQRRAGEKEQRLRVRGRAHGYPDGTVGLSIRTFEIVK